MQVEINFIGQSQEMLEDIVPGGLKLGDPSQGKPYLCYYLHRWLEFRVPDVESAAKLAGHGEDISWGLPYGGNVQSPFWYVYLPSDQAAKEVAERSLLMKVRN